MATVACAVSDSLGGKTRDLKMGTMSLLTTTSTLTGVAVTSRSCTDVLSASNAYVNSNGSNGYFAVGCSTEEVKVGTLIFLKKPNSDINLKSWSVLAIDAPDTFSMDYTGLGVVFAFGLSTVVGFWLLSRSVGLIVNFVRG
jgi:hypothetical protein